MKISFISVSLSDCHYFETKSQTFRLTDPDDHAMRHHKPERLRDDGLPLQPQALHHRAPPGEECQEAHHEHSQEATGPATGNTFLKTLCMRVSVPKTRQHLQGS